MMKSIIQTDDKCYICRKAFGTDTHHIFGAADRWKSEADHEDVHFSKDKSKDLMDRLHKEGQKAYEQTHTREEWMIRYGRNYI